MDVRAIERHAVKMDCTPAMADVVSGAVPRPAVWAPGERWQAWAAATPAWRRICAMHGACTLLDLNSPSEVGALRTLAGDPEHDELYPAAVVTGAGRVFLAVFTGDGCGVTLVGEDRDQPGRLRLRLARADVVRAVQWYTEEQDGLLAVLEDDADLAAWFRFVLAGVAGYGVAELPAGVVVGGDLVTVAAAVDVVDAIKTHIL